MEPIEYDPEQETRYQALGLAVDLFSSNPVRTGFILEVADEFVNYIKNGRFVRVDPNQAELFIAQ